jgi:hypothetical protein
VAVILTIAPKGEADAKGRAFSADLIAHVTADALWNDAETKNVRPIWAVFAGPAEQIRAFSANLLLGNVAMHGKDRGATRFEFLRSAGYRTWTRPLPAGGVVTTFCLPSLLSWAVPVAEEHRFKFACLPSLRWLAAQKFDLDTARRRLLTLEMLAFESGIARQLERHDWSTGRNIHSPAMKLGGIEDAQLHRFLGYGVQLLHYMDHRLPFPIPRDPVFGAWLLLVGVENGPIRMTERAAHRDRGFYRDESMKVADVASAGAAPGFIFAPRFIPDCHLSADLDTQASYLGNWLGAEVQRWHRSK